MANPLMTRAIVSSLNATASGGDDAMHPAAQGCIGKYAMRTLNILQLNINSTQKKSKELASLLHKNNIHVAYLQETNTGNQKQITEVFYFVKIDHFYLSKKLYKLHLPE